MEGLMKNFLVRISVLFVFSCLSFAGLAQAKQLALIVGNGTYLKLPLEHQLRHAKPDARALAKALERMGYQTTLQFDMTRAGFQKGLARFTANIKSGDTVVVYLNGHGARSGGRDHLLPADFPSADEFKSDSLVGGAIAIDDIVERMRKGGGHKVIVIADINRRLAKRVATVKAKSLRSGLARISMPEDVFILYSAGLGQTPVDRLSNAETHPNSVFARSLLPLLAQPGMDISDLARQVSRRVRRLTKEVGKIQTPAYYSGLLGPFTLNPKKQ
jgi:uncharacterized caspase-like protein